MEGGTQRATEYPQASTELGTSEGDRRGGGRGEVQLLAFVECLRLSHSQFCPLPSNTANVLFTPVVTLAPRLLRSPARERYTRSSPSPQENVSTCAHGTASGGPGRATLLEGAMQAFYRRLQYPSRFRRHTFPSMTAANNGGGGRRGRGTAMGRGRSVHARRGEHSHSICDVEE